MLLGRIDLADLRAPKAISRAIFSPLGTIEVPVSKIVRALDIIGEKAQKFDGFEDMFLTQLRTHGEAQFLSLQFISSMKFLPSALRGILRRAFDTPYICAALH